MDVIIINGAVREVKRMRNVDDMYLEWILYVLGDRRRIVHDLGCDIIIIQLL